MHAPADGRARLPEAARVARWLWRAQWPLIGGLGLAALVLGFVGFQAYGRSGGGPTAFWDVLYADLQLFPLQSGGLDPPLPWTLDVARFLAPAAAVFAVAAALAAAFHDELRLMRIRRGGHVVVCGLGRKGMLLTRALRERGDRVVLIEQDPTNELVESSRELGAAVLVGDARDEGLLRKAGVARAAQLVAVCGDDGANAEIAVLAGGLARARRGEPLACLAHIVDRDLCDLLRARELRDPWQGAFALEFFNIFDTGARALLNRYPPFAEEGAPHVLVVGLGQFGASLVAHAARDWWAGRGLEGDVLRVTVVDREATARTRALELHYPRLSEACCLLPLDITVGSPEFDRGGFLSDERGRCDVTAAYVCLDDDGASLSAGLTLQHHLEGLGVTIVVRTTRAVGLASLLGEERQGGLRAFPLLDWTCSPDLLFGGPYETIARTNHEDHVRLAEEQGHTPRTKRSMVSWDELDAQYRRSSLEKARHVGARLRVLGLTIGPLTDWDATRFAFSEGEVERLAELEHERFVAERLAAGWTYAPGTSDPRRRTSPSLLPWSELSDRDQDVDRCDARRIPAVLGRAGFQIVPLRKRDHPVIASHLTEVPS